MGLLNTILAAQGGGIVEQIAGKFGLGACLTISSVQLRRRIEAECACGIEDNSNAI